MEPHPMNEMVPICAEGKGQIFISAVGEECSEDEYRQLREQVAFVFDHRMLFASVTGLDEAAQELNMDIDCDGLSQGHKVYHEKVPGFESLPRKPRSPIYQACLRENRPEFWARWEAFEQQPSAEHWEQLRSYVLPGAAPMETVWTKVEQFYRNRDPEASIMAPVFSEQVPGVDLVKLALIQHCHHAYPELRPERQHDSTSRVIPFSPD